MCLFMTNTRGSSSRADSRLEYLLEFAEEKMLVRLDRTDIFRAKEYSAAVNHRKRLIDVLGKDGGIIPGPRSSIDEVKAENLKAMIEFTKERWRY
jgi:hypothetical protein